MGGVRLEAFRSNGQLLSKFLRSWPAAHSLCHLPPHEFQHFCAAITLPADARRRMNEAKLRFGSGANKIIFGQGDTCRPCTEVSGLHGPMAKNFFASPQPEPPPTPRSSAGQHPRGGRKNVTEKSKFMERQMAGPNGQGPRRIVGNERIA